MVDPDDGGRLAAHGSAPALGAGGARAGLGAPTPLAPAAAPAAASKGWGGLTSWLTGGSGGAAGAAASGMQRPAGSREEEQEQEGRTCALGRHGRR